ncbi:MAG: FAD-dependent oxidoreductase, partial [Gemmataceae bacterium]|nr:FAD-dependent oxidoreductase [Gemmataceae bacterium]
SKALLRSARAAAAVRDAGRFGVIVPEGTRVDFPAVMERMRKIRADLSPNDSAARFKGLGVDVFLGEGRFTGRDTLAVGGQELRFSKALIATGGRPAIPAIPGLGDYLTNETVFDLRELPARLCVLGAGPIGCELAQAFARLGSKVVLIGKEPRVLPREIPEAAALLEASLRRDGIDLRLGVPVQRIEGRSVVVPGDALPFDALLLAAGRRPTVEGLGLEAAGVGFDAERGVAVSDRLRTSNPRIYAAGDVCSRHKHTHAADALARIVLRNALFWGGARESALVVPRCTYTDPEVAHVGLTEQEAAEKGYPASVIVQELREVDRAVLDGEDEGFVRIVQGKGRILGCTIVGARAGEMIGEATLAMVAKAGLATLADTIHPYPTQAAALKRAGDAHNRTRLTPWARWLLGKWLAWSR